MIEHGFDRFAVALHDIEDAVRQARLPASSSASSSGVSGTCSLGFRMKVLPQAMAIGNIHIGTIAGKLNGVMPATTPSGKRRV